MTIDASQGSEFDYVILSTVRANKPGYMGFVKQPQRLCVAMSRAKVQLVIVGKRATIYFRMVLLLLDQIYCDVLSAYNICVYLCFN